MGTREKEIYKVTVIGGVANGLLLVFKFVAGILGNSAAMVADAVHSLSDFATDIVVLVFVKISSNAPDTDHSYGHGKFETLATAFIGLVLLAIGVKIIWSGGENIVFWAKGGQIESPGTLALWAAIISVVIKEILYQFTARVGRKVQSQAVVANAWHHRSDALSSIGTMVGIGGAILLGNRWTILDPIASVIVGGFIIKASLPLLKACMADLTDSSLPEWQKKEILDIVATFPEFSDPHHLHTRKIGNRNAIEMHVRMDGDVSLFDSHEKSRELERRIREHFGNEAFISIHVEPVKIDGVYKRKQSCPTNSQQ